MTPIEFVIEAKIDEINEAYEADKNHGAEVVLDGVTCLVKLTDEVILELIGLTMASAQWPQDGTPVIVYYMDQVNEKVITPIRKIIGVNEVRVIFQTCFTYLYGIKAKRRELIEAANASEDRESLELIVWDPPPAPE